MISAKTAAMVAVLGLSCVVVGQERIDEQRLTELIERVSTGNRVSEVYAELERIGPPAVEALYENLDKPWTSYSLEAMGRKAVHLVPQLVQDLEDALEFRGPKFRVSEAHEIRVSKLWV